MRRAPVVWLAASLLALGSCGDSTSPNEDLARHLERLSAESHAAGHQSRGRALNVAAVAIRRGAPVSTISILKEGAPHQYRAIVYKGATNYYGPEPPEPTHGGHMVAWRGASADELLELLVGPVSPPPPLPPTPDSVVFIRNHGGFRGEVYLYEGQTAQFRIPESGARLDLVRRTGGCPTGGDPTVTCDRLLFDVTFDVTVSGGSPLDTEPTQRTLAASHLRLEGIHYIKLCASTPRPCVGQLYP
jgi:hypothetical protein